MPQVSNSILKDVSCLRVETIRAESVLVYLRGKTVGYTSHDTSMWPEASFRQDGISHKTSPAYIWNTYHFILLERCTNRHNKCKILFITLQNAWKGSFSSEKTLKRAKRRRANLATFDITKRRYVISRCYSTRV